MLTGSWLITETQQMIVWLSWSCFQAWALCFDGFCSPPTQGCWEWLAPSAVWPWSCTLGVEGSQRLVKWLLTRQCATACRKAVWGRNHADQIAPKPYGERGKSSSINGPDSKYFRLCHIPSVWLSFFFNSLKMLKKQTILGVGLTKRGRERVCQSHSFKF